MSGIMSMRNVKTILILGAGIMQMPALRLAKAKGMTVHAADGNPAAAFASLADFFHVVDLKDEAGMLALARSIRDSGGLDGVFTAGTDFSATVAYVAESLNLPGIPRETALDASIKTRMRAAFREHGVPSPDFALVETEDDALTAAEVTGFPLVIKPVDSMGARGVRRIDGVDVLSESFRDAVSHSRSDRVIIERYIDGPEFSVDAVIHDGKMTVCGVADRHVFFPPYFVEMGHTMPSQSRREDIEEIVRVFEMGVRALGISNGAAKGDIKLSGGKGYVGEIAARLSGGYMSGWTYPYSSGREVTSYALDIACGIKPEITESVKADTAAERAFISIPGTVKDVTVLDAARRTDSVRDVFSRCKKGDTVVFPKNNVEKCGNVIAVNPVPSVAKESAEAAAREILIRLEPNDSATEEFLSRSGIERNQDGSIWPPDAFSPHDPGFDAFIVSLGDSSESASLIGPFQSVRPFPGIERLDSRDWQGRGMAQAFQVACIASGIHIDNNADPRFSRIFWEAFLRGGIQGAVYRVDTLKAISD